MNPRLVPLLRAQAESAKAPFNRNRANDSSTDNKPRLLVDRVNPHNTVAALRDILAVHADFFERGGPVRLVRENDGGVVAKFLKPETVVRLAHEACRPYVKRIKGGTEVEEDVPLPSPVAVMYLDMHGERNLRPLNGIVSAPLLREDGTISVNRDYDPDSGLWCAEVPDIAGLVPEEPNRADAERAFRIIRETFATFCFADSPRRRDDGDGLELVDISQPPERDESAFLVALLTAICRASLDHAPGYLFRGASLSGAGTGKGLLARCICTIAYGRQPHAVTRGRTAEEFEKRIVAELIQGGPVIFLDNLNNETVKSDLLASALTERPARVRKLGESEMLPINTLCFVVLTGNGLNVSEDLARRFLTVEFDARTEDPESRTFQNDIKADVTARRSELLAAMLTIWRWGRQSSDRISGRPLGGFEKWSKWVRDPLLALGCRDPVVRIGETKQRDGMRAVVGELYGVWWQHHGSKPVKLRDLHETVARVVDQQGRGRQFLSAQLERLTGTRTAGFVLTRQAPPGRHGVASYALIATDDQRGCIAAIIGPDEPNSPNAISNPDGETETHSSAAIEASSVLESCNGGKVHQDHRGHPPHQFSTGELVGTHDLDAPGAVGDTTKAEPDAMPLMPLVPLTNAETNGDDEGE